MSSSNQSSNAIYVPGVAFAYDYFSNISFAQNTTTLDLLLAKHGIIKLSTIPTHAAFIPMWPEFLATLILSFFFFFRVTVPQRKIERRYTQGRITPAAREEQLAAYHPLKGFINTTLTIIKLILFVVWIISFVTVARDPSEGGWPSVLDWASQYILGVFVE
jgi:hypothetical protein